MLNGVCGFVAGFLKLQSSVKRHKYGIQSCDSKHPHGQVVFT